MNTKKIILNEEALNKVKPLRGQAFMDRNTYIKYVYDFAKHEFVVPEGGDQPPRDPMQRKAEAEMYYGRLYPTAKAAGWAKPRFVFRNPAKMDELLAYLDKLEKAINELEGFLNANNIEIYSPEELKVQAKNDEEFDKVSSQISAELENEIIQRRIKTNARQTNGANPDDVTADSLGSKLYESMKDFFTQLCAEVEDGTTVKSYARVNKKQAALNQQGIPMILKGRKSVNKAVDEGDADRITLAVFYDRSGSWRSVDKTMTARQAVSQLYEFTDASKYNPALEIVEFGFDSDHDDTNMSVLAPYNPELKGDPGMVGVGNRDGFRINVVPYILKNHPQNILICTDSDPRYVLDRKIEIEYSAWFVYVGPKSAPEFNNLQDYIQGRELTKAFYIPYDTVLNTKDRENKEKKKGKR